MFAFIEKTEETVAKTNNNSMSLEFNKRSIEIIKPINSIEEEKLLKGINVIEFSKSLDEPMSIEEFEENPPVHFGLSKDKLTHVVSIKLSDEAIHALHFITSKYLELMVSKNDVDFFDEDVKS